MATIKGQNLRILLGEESTSLKCIGAATQCQVHVQMQVEEDTTKDTEDDFVINEPVGLLWDVTTESIVTDIEYVSAIGADELVVGQIYTLLFSRTIGEQNRQQAAATINMIGQAVLSDLQFNTPNQDVSTATAKFTGIGELKHYIGVETPFELPVTQGQLLAMSAADRYIKFTTPLTMEQVCDGLIIRDEDDYVADLTATTTYIRVNMNGTGVFEIQQDANDLRRWNILSPYPSTSKTYVEFSYNN